MIQLTFTPTEIDDLNEALDNPETPPKIHRKLMALRMHSEGVQNGAIARILNITANTVTEYVKEYRDGGIAAVIEDKAYRPRSSLTPFLPCLRCAFTVHPPATAKEAMATISRLTGISLSEEQTRRTLKNMGMACRRTGQIPGKADPQLQFEFFTQELQPRLKEASKGARKVFFLDAVHFVLGCFLGMIWCFQRIFVRGASGRQRYNVLGAVCSHTREVLTVRSTANVNANTVVELLELIRKRHPDIPISIVLDNARYHRNKLVQQRAAELHVELLFLPPYSPNLNLIERLWKLVKKECLRNRYFATFGAFKAALDQFLDNLNDDYQVELERLISNRFQLFPIS